MDPNPPNGNGNPQPQRKPETLGSVQQGRTIDFIDKLTECKPVIPDAVAMYVMRKNGLDTKDERIIRLISLATQKFISDIALDAMQLARIKGLGQVRKGTRDARFVLNTELLEPVLAEYGIPFSKPTSRD